MSSWSPIELELIIADYFAMLRKELAGIGFSKTEHRNRLLPLLTERSKGSVEFKHQNISAVLVRLGQPYIKGYLPRYNYQGALEDAIIDHLTKNLSLEQEFKKFADDDSLGVQLQMEFGRFIVAPPERSNRVEEPLSLIERNPIKVNYLEREQRNARLGAVGEELVLNYEKWHLQSIGKDNLADRVKWISKEEGDGAGFDILSYTPSGHDKYIEVKTTKLGKETPFYFSRNELHFSQSHRNDYHLYRLFNVIENARMFTLNGGLDRICNSTPVNFQGYF